MMFATITLVVCIPQRIANSVALGYYLAEPLRLARTQGFEPWDVLPPTVFKTAAISRSAMSAYLWLILRSTSNARRCVGNGNHIFPRTRTVFSVCQSLSQAWCCGQKSNPQPSPYKSVALPVELPQQVVGKKNNEKLADHTAERGLTAVGFGGETRTRALLFIRQLL